MSLCAEQDPEMRRHFVQMKIKIKIQQISHTWHPLSIDLRICTALELCHQCCFYYTITCPPAHKKVITILNRHIKVIVMMLLNSSRRKYLIMKNSPPQNTEAEISPQQKAILPCPRCLNPQHRQQNIYYQARSCPIMTSFRLWVSRPSVFILLELSFEVCLYSVPCSSNP